MNAEQHQQQSALAAGLQSTPPQSLSLSLSQSQSQLQLQQPPPPPPPSQLTTTDSYGLQYANVAPPTTYVTIGGMPNIATISTCTPTQLHMTTPPSSTSTFKTPLLPMPTLEDIEVAASQPPPVAVPPGILKYPTPMSTMPMAMSMPMSMPMSLSMPMTGASYSIDAHAMPTATTTTAATAAAVAAAAAAASASTCGTLKSNAKLLGAPTMLPLQLSTPTLTLGMQPPPPPTVMPTGSAASAAGAPKRKEAQQQQQRQRQRQQQPEPGRWCACFGSGGNAAGATGASGSSGTTTGSKTPPSYGSKGKKRKQATQTIWSALLTNLGICTLLLAYTLLGSFIFLTIENEDSALMHQQHTLASTKRNMAANDASNNNNNINIYHQQQQLQRQRQPQPQHQQHRDNDTLTAAVASPHGNERLNLPGAGMDLSNEFVYGEDGLPQFALSPDTYDVRQRTIENIWDITVSLNILYKENWTKLAALEIAKFQDQLIKRLNEDVMLQLSHDDVANGHAGHASPAAGNNPATEAVLLHTHYHHQHHRLGGIAGGGPPHEWNFAKAFLYSLTVLTTIGYGNIAPRTTLGRIVTLAYAFFGIPLTLVYLSSTGSILAKVAREVFSKALCCCLCSNCGYCCYDEKRMAEKERRMKRKRQQEELRKQQAAMQEPYYVRDVYHATPEKEPGGVAGAGAGGAAVGTPTMPAMAAPTMPADIDSLSASESRGSMHGLSILAPILLCFSMMIIYIVFGAAVLYRLENWPIIDGIYFCFMSLSTIGFGDMLPTLRRESNTTTWFCSVYIMSGMTLTAMCFNVIHEEIIHRIRIVVEFKNSNSVAVGGTAGSMLDMAHEEGQYYMPPS